MLTTTRNLGFAAVIAAVVGCAVYAAAATLGGVTARGLGAGKTTVTSCDGDGVTIAYTTSSGSVTGVTISDIAAGCSGGSLKVVLANSAGTNIGAGGPATVGGATVSLSLSPQPAASNVAAAHVSIAGP